MMPPSFYKEHLCYSNYTPDASASVVQSVELWKKDGGCWGVEHFVRFWWLYCKSWRRKWTLSAKLKEKWHGKKYSRWETLKFQGICCVSLTLACWSGICLQQSSYFHWDVDIEILDLTCCAPVLLHCRKVVPMTVVLISSSVPRAEFELCSISFLIPS